MRWNDVRQPAPDDVAGARPSVVAPALRNTARADWGPRHQVDVHADPVRSARSHVRRDRLAPTHRIDVHRRTPDRRPMASIAGIAHVPRSLSEHDVRKIAALARLELSPTKSSSSRSSSPTSSPTPTSCRRSTRRACRRRRTRSPRPLWRDDEPLPSLDRDAVLAERARRIASRRASSRCRRSSDGMCRPVSDRERPARRHRRGHAVGRRRRAGRRSTASPRRTVALHAFHHVDAERALARARALDREPAPRGSAAWRADRAQGQHRRPRASRPRPGRRILEHYVSPFDATVVEKLEAAGAVIVGKTICDEFAMGSSTENSRVRPVAQSVGTGSRARADRAADRPSPWRPA